MSSASTLIDLVIMTPSSAFGTSTTIPLGSAAVVNSVTYLSFSAAGATNGQQISYSILDPVGGGSEIGLATYNTTGVSLTGRSPTKSTNGGAAITASSGSLILGSVRAEDLNSFIVAGQTPGTSAADDASAGNVGEFVQTIIPVSSAIALTSATPKNIASISLSAGDWDIEATPIFLSGATTPVTVLSGSISSQSSVIQAVTFQWSQFGSNTPLNPGVFNQSFLTLGPFRVSLSASATYNLVMQGNFSSGTLSGWGGIRARRIR